MTNKPKNLPTRKFSDSQRKKWRQNIFDIYRRMKEKSKNGVFEVRFGKIFLSVLPNVYDPVAFTDTLWFAKQIQKIVGKKSLLEIGTGSGAIAVSAALNGAKVVATDINPDAVKNARLNTKKTKTKVDVRQGNLYEPIGKNEKFDFIFWAHPFNNWGTPVSNMLLRSGLDYKYKGLRGYIAGAKKHLNSGGKLLLGTGDSADLKTIAEEAKKNGYSLKLLKKITMPLEKKGKAKITDLLYEFVANKK